MEKETRISRYKELRDELKEDANVKQYQTNVLDEDDDFLAFIRHDDKINDTLSQPLTFEDADDNKTAKRVVTEANYQDTQFDTKMNIYNRIKNNGDLNDVVYHRVKEPVVEEVEEEFVEEETVDKFNSFIDDVEQVTAKDEVEEVESGTLLDKLAAISSEEDQAAYEALKEETNGEFDKPEYESFLPEKDEPVEVVEEDEEEEVETGNEKSKIAKILDILTVILLLALVVVIGLIVKQLLF